MKVGASILSARFSHLADEVKKAEESGVDFLHFDVMDGSITNTITFGPILIKSLRKLSCLPFDIHCYLLDPVRYIEPLINAGADSITIHVEALGKIIWALDLIKKYGVKAGIALLPETPPVSISQVLDMVDSVTVVTVDVMKSNSWEFIPVMVKKIKEVHELIDKKILKIELKVDGGINLGNAQKVITAGAHSLIVGNALFNSNDMKETVKLLKGSNC
ncbi:MAG: ribulose-phosphate 3-epimerase [Candidatus Methanomethylicia archaeon]